MNWTPLLQASFLVQIHVITAISALMLGSLQFFLPQGGTWHKRVGRVWVISMLSVAFSSLLIHQIRMFGLWSPLHLLSILTLVMLTIGVIAIVKGNKRLHRNIMLSLFWFALIIPGLFTLLPGRLLHSIVFGG